MKSWILTNLLSLALVGRILAHDQQGSLSSQATGDILYLPYISQEEIQQFMDHPSDIILVCPQGTTLPLSFFLTGDLLELEKSDHAAYLLKIKQTFYLRCQEKALFISLDGLTWKTWQEMLTGMLSVNLSVADGPQLQLGAEVHLR